MDTKKAFDEASKTGRSVVLLKALDVCDCHNPDDLFNSEPDAYCLKCYGTGRKRLKIQTEKIRIDMYGSGSKKGETTEHTDTNVEMSTFFLDGKYHFLTSEDLVATIREDGSRSFTSIYEVANRERFDLDDFTYYEIAGKRINTLTEVVLNA